MVKNLARNESSLAEVRFRTVALRFGVHFHGKYFQSFSISV